MTNTDPEILRDMQSDTISHLNGILGRFFEEGTTERLKTQQALYKINPEAEICTKPDIHVKDRVATVYTVNQYLILVWVLYWNEVIDEGAEDYVTLRDALRDLYRDLLEIERELTVDLEIDEVELHERASKVFGKGKDVADFTSDDNVDMIDAPPLKDKGKGKAKMEGSSKSTAGSAQRDKPTPTPAKLPTMSGWLDNPAIRSATAPAPRKAKPKTKQGAQSNTLASYLSPIGNGEAGESSTKTSSEDSKRARQNSLPGASLSAATQPKKAKFEHVTEDEDDGGMYSEED